MLIHTGQDKISYGSFVSDEEWHELRFILLDEVEAAGAGLLGQLEENLRLKVPSTNTALRGLHKEQHASRERNYGFAGVNVLCFGDFWQLGPTGDTSVSTNPMKSSGNPHEPR